MTISQLNGPRAAGASPARWVSQARHRQFQAQRERAEVFHAGRVAFGRALHLRPWRAWQRPNLGHFGLTCTDVRKGVRGASLPALDHHAAYMLRRQLAVVVSWPYADPERVIAELADLPPRFVWAVVLSGPAGRVYPTTEMSYVLADRQVLGADGAAEVLAQFTAGRWSRRPAARQAALNAELASLYPLLSEAA